MCWKSTVAGRWPPSGTRWLLDANRWIDLFLSFRFGCDNTRPQEKDRKEGETSFLRRRLLSVLVDFGLLIHRAQDGWTRRVDRPSLDGRVWPSSGLPYWILSGDGWPAGQFFFSRRSSWNQPESKSSRDDDDSSSIVPSNTTVARWFI